MELRGYVVVAGYICPSSDRYVSGKLGSEAMSLVHRNNMCRMAVKDSEWIDLCDWGDASGPRTTDRIQRLLTQKLSSSTKWKDVKIFTIEMCGADHAARYSLWMTPEPLICVGRPGYSHIVSKGLTVRQQGFVSSLYTSFFSSSVTISTTTSSTSSKLPPPISNFIFIDEDLKPISSTDIRPLLIHLVEQKDLEEEKGSGGKEEEQLLEFLHLGVVEYLKIRKVSVYMRSQRPK